MFGDVLAGDIEPPAASVVTFGRFTAVEHLPQGSDDRLVVQFQAAAECRSTDDGLVAGVFRSIGILLFEAVERIHGLQHGPGEVGVAGLEVDRVALYGPAVACGPLLQVAHGAVARQVGTGHEERSLLLFDQIREGKRRGVMVVGVVPHDHREGTLEGRRHDVGPGGELAAARVHGLVYGAALEQVVALVRAAAGVEEREHAGDQQRGFVVRDGVGPGKDRCRLAVLAVGVGEEERFGGRKSLVQTAVLAHEAAFDRCPVVDPGSFGRDEVVGLDIHADPDAVAERSVAEHRGSIDGDVVADAHFADEAGADDPAVAAHLAHLRGPVPGVRVDHTFQGGDGLRPVSVDGHQVGDLGRHRIEDLHGAAAAFVHRGYRDTVAE